MTRLEVIIVPNNIISISSNVLQRNTFLNHIVVLELASGASESCYLTVQEFRVIVLNISFDFDEEGLLVKFVFCNNVNLVAKRWFPKWRFRKCEYMAYLECGGRCSSEVLSFPGIAD